MLDKMYSDKCDTFHAKYKILEKIGEGSFSEVLKCLNKSTGVLYAAKRLRKCYKLGLSEQKSKEYLYQLLRGLEHLHRNGLFHRDVKPENILIKFPSIENTRLQKVRKHEIIKLADLGSVRGIYSIPPYTEYISTRWYRSPECLLSNGNYGPKMDVWATGCVFYEMMTLLPLFPGSNEIDQLYKIHHILGSPSMQFISKLKSRSRNCVAFPKTKGTGIDALLPQLTRQTRGILELMIEYDADKRVNIRRLLKNPYFDDIRQKFEPTMEGQSFNVKSYSSHRMPEYGKRSNGDITAVKQKIIKRDHWSGESKRRRSHSSASSDGKGSTPSIEIPYYTPVRSGSTGKHNSLPLVDYKLSQYVENSRVKSSESNKSCGVSRKSSIKRSVEIILKSSRNSESGKHSSSKEKVDPSRFYSKSLTISKKNGYNAVDAQPNFIKAKTHKIKNSMKHNKPST